MFLFTEAVLKHPQTKGSDENAVEKEANNCMRNWRTNVSEEKELAVFKVSPTDEHAIN